MLYKYLRPGFDVSTLPLHRVIALKDRLAEDLDKQASSKGGTKITSIDQLALFSS